jgi:HEAT repeat protein
VRAYAIRILTQHDDRSCLSTYRAFARDPSRDLAQAAVFALGRFGVIPPLVEALGHSDWRVREHASRALAAIDHPDVRAALAVGMQSTNEHVRAAATTALNWSVNREESPEVLAQLVRRDSRSRNERAQQELVRMGSNAVDTVASLLADEEPDVRVAAIDMLRRMNLEASVPPLLRALNDDHTGVRIAAAEALGTMHRASAFRALFIAVKDHDLGVREAAVAALGRMADDQTKPLFIKLARAADWRSRSRAIRTLGTLGGTGIADLLQEGLSDEHWRVRRAAADAIGKRGESAATDCLVLALADTHWCVRRSAHEALVRITGEERGRDQAAWQHAVGRPDGSVGR